MKKTILVLIVAVMVIAGFWYWYQTSRASVGNLNIYTGTVEIKRGDTVVAGQTGSELRVSDILKVSDIGRAAIIFKDDSVVRLEAKTEVEISKLAYKGNSLKDVLLKLKSGRLWSNLKPIESGGEYDVQTPTIVAAVRGTIFNVDYLNSTSSIYVDDRSVDVGLLSGDDEKTVNENQVFNISDANNNQDFAKGPTNVAETYGDSWIKFNQSQDKGSSLTTQPSGSARPSTTPAPIPNRKPTSLKVSYLQDRELRGQNFITIQFTAEVQFTDGSVEDLTNTVRWSVTGSAKGVIDNKGLYRVEAPGTDTVTATYLNLSGSVKIETK